MKLYTIIILLFIFSSCDKKNIYCESINKVQLYEKGHRTDLEQLNESIKILEEKTQVLCPKDGSLLNLYQPNDQVLSEWRIALKKHGIEC